MRITKLHIENFRGFRGTHDIEFSDSNIHAVVGVNGAGKTSILDAIGIIFEKATFQLVRDNNKKDIKRKDVSLGTKKAFIECEFKAGANNAIAESNHAEINGITFTTPFYEQTKSELSNTLLEINKTSQSTLDEIIIETDLYSSTTKDYSSFLSLPLLAYYRAERGFSERQFSHTVSLLSGAERVCTYFYAFENIIDIKAAFAWYVQQINIQNNEKVKRKDLSYELPTISSITKAVNVFLKNLQDNSLTNISMDVSKYSSEQILVINKSDKQIEFNQLSNGEKISIGMVLDIAYRMSIANPHLENPLISEGIVLIDELEQHLHPKWQMSILKALTATFPNVQFIVTTHSPLVINQLENDQLSILDNFKITSGKEVHKVYGRDVNAIIEDFMGASDRPLDVKALMNDVEKLLDEDHPNIERARKKLNELKAIIDPNDYDVIKLETQIVMEEDDEAY